MNSPGLVFTSPDIMSTDVYFIATSDLSPSARAMRARERPRDGCKKFYCDLYLASPCRELVRIFHALESLRFLWAQDKIQGRWTDYATKALWNTIAVLISRLLQTKQKVWFEMKVCTSFYDLIMISAMKRNFLTNTLFSSLSTVLQTEKLKN